ncbi:hypothetical protein [Heliorestis acidaminivorans]|nr:hypothetical protein [Heliorestis acidaminivorans]
MVGPVGLAMEVRPRFAHCPQIGVVLVFECYNCGDVAVEEALAGDGG